MNTAQKAIECSALASQPIIIGCDHIGPQSWIDSTEFADLINISSRNARKAIRNASQGKTWRNHRIDVRIQTGGGHREKYLVNVYSLPAELKDRWLNQQAVESLSSTVPSKVTELPFLVRDPHKRKRSREALWRHSIIEEALSFPKSSSDRAQAIRKTVAKQHKTIDGRNVSIGEWTAYKWIRDYEANGYAGLERKIRSDSNQKRVLVSRKFDQECPLPDDIREDIKSEIGLYIKSLWAAGVPSWTHVSQLAASKLHEICMQRGWNASDGICDVKRTLVEAYRDYSLVAIAGKDAKRYFDHYEPRILRNREGIEPVDLVVGDVHPIDVGVVREDGIIAYPRLISWLDIATNRIHNTLILCRKGEGVRREHIAHSFAAMAEEWGLPSALYLDNGSEYSWDQMMDAFSELSAMAAGFKVFNLEDDHNIKNQVDVARSIIRARPYNAQAKPIEGTFGNLEMGSISMVPGWVGGNRMRKKTHNVGKEPKPYPGTWEQFRDDFSNVTKYYHTTPQQGSLDGKSPFESYQAFIDKGWAKSHIESEALLVSFADEQKRTPLGGRVSWNGRSFYHDDLLKYTRELTVRVARHRPDVAFIFDDKTLICAAYTDKTYSFTDGAGAKEQSRRAGVLRKVVKAKGDNVVSLDLMSEMDRHLSTKSGMPEAPVGQVISLSPEAQQMLDAHQSQQTSEEKQRSDNTSLSLNASQWICDDEQDEYLDSVNFDDD